MKQWNKADNKIQDVALGFFFDQPSNPQVADSIPAGWSRHAH